MAVAAIVKAVVVNNRRCRRIRPEAAVTAVAPEPVLNAQLQKNKTLPVKSVYGLL